MPSNAPAGAAQLMRKALRTPASATPRRAVKVNPEGIVRAIVSVTGVVDAVNDLIVPGAFAVTLKKRRPKVVDDHEWGRKAGRVLHIEEWKPGDKRLPTHTKDGQPWPLEAGALVATIQYNMDSEQGRESFGWVKFYADSAEAEFSIGYKVPPGKARKRHDGVRVILEVDLFELSHVLFGAAPLSMALEVKSLEAGTGGAVTKPALGEDEEVEPMEPEHPWDTPKKGAKAKATLEAKSAAAVLADAMGVPMLEMKVARMRGSYEERAQLLEPATLDLLNSAGDTCWGWVCLEATYDHEVIVTAFEKHDGGTKASFVIPYTYNAISGTVELAEAQPVELSMVASTPRDEQGPEPTDEPADELGPKGFLATVQEAFYRAQAVNGMEGKGAPGEKAVEPVGETYSIDYLPDAEFDLYSKTEPIEATRMTEAFSVETREGLVTGDAGGWLALDSDGYPYPIAAEEFDNVYEPYQAGVESPSPTDELETKEPAEDETPAPAPAPAEDEEGEEMVTIDPDKHFADMAELHADDAPEDDEAA